MSKSKLLGGQAGQVFSEMPLLDHNPTGTFDPALSEVYNWIREQDAIIHWAFENAKDKGKIKYDPGRGKWYGVNSLD